MSVISKLTMVRDKVRDRYKSKLRQRAKSKRATMAKKKRGLLLEQKRLKTQREYFEVKAATSREKAATTRARHEAGEYTFGERVSRGVSKALTDVKRVKKPVKQPGRKHKGSSWEKMLWG